jgi:serine/threonine-protein phosphatase 2A regulatory subunit A
LSRAAMSTIDPLQLLRDDLKDDDFETLMAAINRLHVIGLALGQARCRSELIPFLTGVT